LKKRARVRAQARARAIKKPIPRVLKKTGNPLFPCSLLRTAKQDAENVTLS
jgi:hypothetical protein